MGSICFYLHIYTCDENCKSLTGRDADYSIVELSQRFDQNTLRFSLLAHELTIIRQSRAFPVRGPQKCRRLLGRASREQQQIKNIAAGGRIEG